MIKWIIVGGLVASCVVLLARIVFAETFLKKRESRLAAIRSEKAQLVALQEHRCAINGGWSQNPEALNF
ncbi:MAG TPA: hypothetical protein VJI70_02435 [Candidatus Paceibacterota bacterium]